MSYSIVGAPLADVPPDVITRAAMHVILGLMKKILEWIFKMFAKLEALEEKATVGHTAGLPISCTLGPRWEAVIIRSNFKSEAIFGFLGPYYTGHVTCFFL